jgi:hypothetical protein
VELSIWFLGNPENFTAAGLIRRFDTPKQCVRCFGTRVDKMFAPSNQKRRLRLNVAGNGCEYGFGALRECWGRSDRFGTIAGSDTMTNSKPGAT